MVDAVRRALGPDAPPGSPIEALVGELVDELDAMYEHWDDDHHPDLTVIQRFSELIESTPSLRAAQRDMMERIAQVAAESLAERAGMDPTDPEPQIAADAMVGLWRVQYTAMKKYSDGSRTPAEVHDAVVDEIRRAARLVDTGLWSFNLVVQGSATRQQLKVAADAANDARKQVIVAIKAARVAWREVAAEVQAHHQGEAGDPGGGPRDVPRAAADRGNRADREQIQQTVLRERQNTDARSRRPSARCRRRTGRSARPRLRPRQRRTPARTDELPLPPLIPRHDCGTPWASELERFAEPKWLPSNQSRPVNLLTRGVVTEAGSRSVGPRPVPQSLWATSSDRWGPRVAYLVRRRGAGTGVDRCHGGLGAQTLSWTQTKGNAHAHPQPARRQCRRAGDLVLDRVHPGSGPPRSGTPASGSKGRR